MQPSLWIRTTKVLLWDNFLFSWTFCCDPQTIGFNWHHGLQRTFWPRWRTGKTCLENVTLICMPQQYRFGFDGRPFLRHLGYGASWGVLETTMQRGHFKMEYRSWNSSSTNSHTSTLWRVRHVGENQHIDHLLSSQSKPGSSHRSTNHTLSEDVLVAWLPGFCFLEWTL